MWPRRAPAGRERPITGAAEPRARLRRESADHSHRPCALQARLRGPRGCSIAKDWWWPVGLWESRGPRRRYKRHPLSDSRPKSAEVFAKDKTRGGSVYYLGPRRGTLV